MTYVELFREITEDAYKRHGIPLDKSKFIFAELAVPDCIHEEVPEEFVETFREMGAREADAIIAMGQKKVMKEITKQLSKN